MEIRPDKDANPDWLCPLFLPISSLFPPVILFLLIRSTTLQLLLLCWAISELGNPDGERLREETQDHGGGSSHPLPQDPAPQARPVPAAGHLPSPSSLLIHDLPLINAESLLPHGHGACFFLDLDRQLKWWFPIFEDFCPCLVVLLDIFSIAYAKWKRESLLPSPHDRRSVYSKLPLLLWRYD